VCSSDLLDPGTIIMPIRVVRLQNGLVNIGISIYPTTLNATHNLTQLNRTCDDHYLIEGKKCTTACQVALLRYK
jgi:hypothetical protein